VGLSRRNFRTVVLAWISAEWQAWITLIVSPLSLLLIIAGLVSAKSILAFCTPT